MDCKTARMLIEFALPRSGELDQQESEALDNHLHDCGECAQAARVELHAEHHLGGAMRDVMVPSGLRERILERMQSERRPWYRRRAGRFVAAAAAVLLSVGIGVGYWIGFYRPAFDASAFAEKLPSPGNESSADQLEIWFRDTYRVKTTMPRRIDYQYFVSAGREELDGQLIPHLIFINEKNRLFAEVWVLTADRFDIKRTLQKAAQGGSGKMMFKLIEDEQHPESVVYLIRYSGDSLDWLITQQATNI